MFTYYLITSVWILQSLLCCKLLSWIQGQTELFDLGMDRLAINHVRL